MTADYRPYLLALNSTRGLGPITLKKILDSFPNPQVAWQANFSDLKNIGLPEKFIHRLLQTKKDINPFSLLDELTKLKINLLTIYDQAYPPLLKQIYAPPIVLYYLGQIKNQFNLPSLAVVGARKMTNYGRTILPQLIRELAPYHAHIISGLAYGIDSLAHTSALENGLLTSAVVGSGLKPEFIYPAGQHKLVSRILDSGGLIFSEFPPTEQARPEYFPRRNRIIAGLAQATFVVEANIKSGSLITAKYALDEAREVLSLPGNIDQPNARGTNFLIKNGAIPVTDVADICQALNLTYSTEPVIKKPQPANKIEAKILPLLSKSPSEVDTIIQETKLTAEVVNACLTQMELDGKVRNVEGIGYSI